MRIEFRYGKKIQQAREARAWTQEQLAIAAGVEPRTIQRVERDQTKNPETLQAIAAAFDLELDALRSKWRVAESHLVGGMVGNNIQGVRGCARGSPVAYVVSLSCRASYGGRPGAS